MSETPDADRHAAERIAIDLGRPWMSDDQMAEFRQRFAEAQRTGHPHVLSDYLPGDAAVLDQAAGVIERHARPRGPIGRFLLGVQLRLLRDTADSLRRKAGAAGLTRHPAGRARR